MQRSVDYFRTLTAQARSARANRHLGFALAGVAGATNAGGFLAVHQYTSHMTGIVTDIGIELGKLLYWNADANATPRVAANHARLVMLCTLLGCFFGGGVAGVLGFKVLGYAATVPLALLLCGLAIVPALDDVRGALRRR